MNSQIKDESTASKPPSLPPIHHLPPRKRLSLEKNKNPLNVISNKVNDEYKEKVQPLKKTYSKTAVASIIANQNKVQQKTISNNNGNPLLWNNMNMKDISEDTIIDSFKEAWFKNHTNDKIVVEKKKERTSSISATTTTIIAKKKEHKISSKQTNSNFDSKLYCICRQPYDARRFMIACDRCDDWFHGECMGINEKESEFIDLYFCKACSDVIGKKTSWKPKCSNPACYKAARIGSNLLGYLSKYCSDSCGLQVARARLELVEIKRRQNNTTNSSSSPTQKNKSIIELALAKQRQSYINSMADKEDRQRLEEIKQEKRLIQDSISIIQERYQLLEQTLLVVDNNNSDSSSSSICGFDSRLIYDTEENKKVCQRHACLQHYKWKELFPVKFEQEKQEEYKRLFKLEKEQNQIKSRMKKRRSEKEIMKNLGNMTYLY
ncbi:uncharacterized protein BX663DRAFT_523535 [Cokeromyces recurvatus]|uniref:uncharacterized protein n=1 Tax=Cokeromyces recurvatus TaxID=90255 RepID=UPI00221FBF0D|nr:uncharacterized protein BX663DRAFT_523535 [Cokeromyces recurvatus]KAI7898803.1 hypothetical protein BX663DRAFT_523535 [Cokeromyces recurvatus]